MDDVKQAGRAWVQAETRRGRRDARPVIAAGLAGVALAAGQAWCVAAILGAALEGHGASRLGLLAVIAAIALARTMVALFADGRAVEAGASARRRLRSGILDRLLHAAPSALRNRHSAELAAIVVDRIEGLDGLYARWIPAATLAIAGPLLVLAVVLWADPVAALVLFLAGLMVPVAMALSGIGAAAASRRQFQALSRLQVRFVDRVRGIATIVLAGQAESEARALAKSADELRRRTMRVLRVAFLSSAALDCALAAALVVLAVRYGGQAAAGKMHPASALFAFLLVPEFFAPLRAFSAAYQDRMQGIGAAEALAGIPPLPAPATALPIRNVEARGVTIAFDDVRLTWDASRGPALDGLSFRVPAGETLVLAGASGAGKSTVLEILLGFAQPSAGRVTVNGADLASIVPSALSKMTAWIGQRPVLFADTLRANILFGRPDATAAEVEAAARNARVMAFADELPEGLETVIGEGGYGLSGGQAQRIAIARAFLKNAPLLLLDEPTSHLDPATESEVLDSLRRLAVGRTVVLASHSSAAHAFSGRRIDLRNGKALAARGAA